MNTETDKINYKRLLVAPMLIGITVLIVVALVVMVLQRFFNTNTSHYAAIFGYSTYGVIVFLSTLKNRHAKISHLFLMCANLVLTPLIIFSLLDILSGRSVNTSLLSWFYLFLTALSFSIILKYIMKRLSNYSKK
jgi:hypothetical protein